MKLTFAEISKQLRKEKRLSQVELAKALNVSNGCIAMLETNKSEPTANTLAKYADFFGCSTDFLLDREDDATLSFTPKERALGVVDNAPIPLSDKDKELIHLFDEAEEKLGADYVQGVKQMVRLAINLKK